MQAATTYKKEISSTESKNETEALLRKAMDEYENQAFVAKVSNIKLIDMLDMWIEEELSPSKRSNGTEWSYLNTTNWIKQHLNKSFSYNFVLNNF